MKLLEKKIIEFDESLEIKDGLETEGKYGDQFIYWGKVNQDGEYHGIGRLETSDGRVYTGQFKNGKANGFAVGIFGSDNYYQGFWRDTKRFGEGRQRDHGQVQWGMWKDYVCTPFRDDY